MSYCVADRSESIWTKQTRRNGVKLRNEFVCRDLDEEIGRKCEKQKKI